MKYKNKPKIIEAEQWSPDKYVDGVFYDTVEKKYFVVTIHEQRCYLAPGDYVITEPNGTNHYPCKPDIFEKSYEPVPPKYPIRPPIIRSET